MENKKETDINAEALCDGFLKYVPPLQEIIGEEGKTCMSKEAREVITTIYDLPNTTKMEIVLGTLASMTVVQKKAMLHASEQFVVQSTLRGMADYIKTRTEGEGEEK